MSNFSMISLLVKQFWWRELASTYMILRSIMFKKWLHMNKKGSQNTNFEFYALFVDVLKHEGESKLASQLNYENSSYTYTGNVSSVVFIWSVCEALATFWYQILLSPICLFIHSLPGIIQNFCLPYLAAPFLYTPMVFFHEIIITLSHCSIAQASFPFIYITEMLCSFLLFM